MSLVKKLALVASNAMILLLALAPNAFAQAAEAAAAAPAADAPIDSTRYIAAGIAITFAAAGCGIGQGLAGKGALEGIARNPSAYSKIFTPMILAFALIESLAIYAFIIALMSIL